MHPNKKRCVKSTIVELNERRSNCTTSVSSLGNDATSGLGNRPAMTFVESDEERTENTSTKQKSKFETLVPTRETSANFGVRGTKFACVDGFGPANHQTKYSGTTGKENTPDFPLKTKNQFDDLEAKLSLPTSDVLKSYLVRRLAAVGDAGIEQLTRRIMRFVITNELAVLYNWKGRDKISFEKTGLMAIIYEAAKLQFPASEQSDKSIASAVAGWLKQAKARTKTSSK